MTFRFLLSVAFLLLSASAFAGGGSGPGNMIAIGSWAPGDCPVSLGSIVFQAGPCGGGGAGTVTSITAGTGLTGGTITTSGTIAIGTTITAGGPIGSSSIIPVITWNAEGQLTAVGTAAAGGGGTITLGTSASVTNPQRTGDATTGLFSPTTATVATAVGGTEEIRVTSAGLGIGTTSPAAKLDVWGNGKIDINGSTGIWIPSADSSSIAIGAGAMGGATISNGNANTAIGQFTLDSDTSGFNNTAIGQSAMIDNDVGNNDTAIGVLSLSHTTASNNTGFGANSLLHDTTGGGNIGLGAYSLFNANVGGGNTAVGYNTGPSIITGTGNILIGIQVDTPLATDASNTLNIGNAIYGTSINSSPKIGIGTSMPLSTLSISGLGATSPGTGGGYVCADSAGDLYVKSSCP